MSGLAFLLIALAISVIGSFVLWLRTRRPSSLDSGIDSFRREMRALAPQSMLHDSTTADSTTADSTTTDSATTDSTTTDSVLHDPTMADSVLHDPTMADSVRVDAGRGEAPAERRRGDGGDRGRRRPG